MVLVRFTCLVGLRLEATFSLAFGYALRTACVAGPLSAKLARPSLFTAGAPQHQTHCALGEAVSQYKVAGLTPQICGYLRATCISTTVVRQGASDD